MRGKPRMKIQRTDTVFAQAQVREEKRRGRKREVEDATEQKNRNAPDNWLTKTETTLLSL